jgi:hypothetical protein
MFARGTAIVSAAAICAGAFALMTQPSASEGAQVTAKIDDRHPAYAAEVEPAAFTLRKAASEAPVPQTVNIEAKGDLAPSSDCAAQTWPRIDAACLTFASGTERPAVRTVSINDNLATATSVVTRAEATVTAAAQ